jgi:hypothetical protein
MRKSNAVPALIPALIREGLSDVEIANRMGWTIGTLRVRCSQLKISLRANPKQVAISRATLELLHQRAARMGRSTSALAAELLEATARDSLYDAVLGLQEPEVTPHPARYVRANCAD